MKQIFLVILLATSSQVFAQSGDFIETNGVRLYYEIHGEGEPLVLLHGNTGTHDTWAQWLDELSREYKIITVDLRGHGQSTHPIHEVTHNDYALDIFGLLDAIDVDKFSAMGHSTGGMTLIHMGTMQSERIKSLILIGATPYFSTETRKKMKMLGYDQIAEDSPQWIENMQDAHPGGEEQIRSLLGNYVRWAEIYDDMNFTPPYLSRISCPTLIIHGDQDSFFPVEIPTDLHENIPDSFLWIIPNFGHSIPQKGTVLGDMFLSSIKEFMAGNWDE
jgi:pimeloyl-ACP methyl ester carboxylesterase